ncbi:2-hydroxychromene-2-carboxylate isomerase [Bradyrhizobium japonicum]|uniref:2-hydroxychromene-2-carboxylate isomerase n=1 Tax=Bradyrhizobium japonicum TaxID=375 RepID=UPI000413C7C6|nr:2-hydroxychromene-2-carboxylate isomerase [Bradyrhizobium japonicum]WLB86834.1 2-hydroxychromene-2-carboxylate isomerase [Bradyrhizobium japonicum USDA 135]
MTIEFVYDYRSPYSYLADTQLKKLSTDITYKPVDITSVMKAVNNHPSPMCPPKARYAVADAGRWAKHYGVPFTPNGGLMRAMGAGRFDGMLLSCAGLAAQELNIFNNAHKALFEAIWASTCDLTAEADRKNFFGERGIDAEELWSRASSSRIRDLLAKNDSEAAERGVCGVPTVFVGDEMFFGNDRLQFVRARLHGMPIEGAAA